MTGLKSHPDKTLVVHVAEVREAAVLIWNSHSDWLREKSSQVESWWQWAVTLHDAGKGTAAFQQYIQNPKAYKKERRLKAHTPFSFLTTLAFGRSSGWDWRQTLAAAACAADHHSEFKTHDTLSNLLRVRQDVLTGQLEDFGWAELASAIGCRIEPIPSNTDTIDELADWFDEDLVEDRLHALETGESLHFRLLCQLSHSVLLEADKAYLAIESNERNRFREHTYRKLNPHIVLKFLRTKKRGSLDSLRTRVREVMSEGIRRGRQHAVQTMTLPTGSGKTLLAASWALTHRHEAQTPSHTPPVVLVLPFLSIIEQTQREYEELLEGTASVLSYHSLSFREHQDSEDPDTAEFFLDTWHGDVIITTFDQLLFALLDPRTRHQMRFHQLCDALIVIDEVQALPCCLWDIVCHTLEQLTRLGNARILAMSATQTGFLPSAHELIANPAEVFRELDRYEIVLRHRAELSIVDFLKQVETRASNWGDKRVLIVLNTRKSARTVRDRLVNEGFEVEFLSADITPMERLATIDRIKAGNPCTVIATQCIEAGVDIDMELVIRDFAPLDSLIQVAGRCNRHNDRSREQIEVVSLVNERGNSYARMIYDSVLLQATQSVLGDWAQDQPDGDHVPEEEVYDLTKRYFDIVSREKNKGEAYTEKFARWERFPPIRELLRGSRGNEVAFVVVDQDVDLPSELERINGIADSWERRRELRKLSGRIASVTVTVFAQKAFRPDRYADEDATGCFWLLRRGYYTFGRGVDFDQDNFCDEESLWGVLI